MPSRAMFRWLLYYSTFSPGLSTPSSFAKSIRLMCFAAIYLRSSRMLQGSSIILP